MLMLGWTTLETKADALRLAETLIKSGLAACVQIDGPITSVYRWEGKVNVAEEFRLLVKFIPALAPKVSEFIASHHPYSTPEWVVVRAEEVAEKYLSWARANSTSAPL
jgi:periplasmic divalent cation tolerance protein